jgi:hypothetical protein
MEERRRAKRTPSILEGRIRLENQASLISCTIRDLSATGARIWLPEAVSLPTEFELEIPKLGQSLKVRLAWSKAQTHGVMFLEELLDDAGDDVTSLLEALQEVPVSSPQSSQGAATHWQQFLDRIWRRRR